MKVPGYIGLATAAILATVACQKKISPPTAAGLADPETASAAVTQLPAMRVGAANSSAETAPGVLRAYVWACADGEKVVMRHLGREPAIALDLHDGTRRLEQLSSASGVLYKDAFVRFSTDGGAATLERKGTPAVRCTEMRDESLRESGRLGAR
jgi:membrane-bound inhibitor of C-type lysozyme